MIKKSFKLISVLMLVSIISLIVIQFFILDTYSTKINQQFSYKVSNILDNILEKYIKEKVEQKIVENKMEILLNKNISDVNKTLLNKIIYGILVDEKNILSEFNINYLKKFIKEELSKNEIESNFEIAIFDHSSKSIVNKSEGFELPENTNSNNFFKKNIFEFKKLPNNLKILIYFPDNKMYTNETFSLMSIASMGFIFVIILSFLTTIYIFVDQKKISEMKGDFINNMTHEFKTPITTISLASQMLGRDPEKLSLEKIKHFTSIIEKENQRLANFVDRILQMSIYDKGHLKLILKQIKINDIILNISEKIHSIYNPQNFKFEMKLNAQYDLINGDEIHITNVINNLIENATKYAKGIPHILITTKNKNDNIHISVKDFGIGISKKYIGKIFEEFYRVPQGNIHNFKGFGLGLAYVKKIILKHNGEIFAESEHGKWTEINIILPLLKKNNNKYEREDELIIS